ncbi:hypothetical protein [Aeromicrobium ginsengisoli]|uniref:hypothetical protein n=1 Tax=Aeromicrobium ginsengisoli TaxID=363867 RepID=UPI00165ED636|nr:hypothetical protein [Aeromicrobium ginsengisoli]
MLQSLRRIRPAFSSRRLKGKDKFATKDTIEHNAVNRDDVQVDNFDFAPINKNAADTFH